LNDWYRRFHPSAVDPFLFWDGCVLAAEAVSTLRHISCVQEYLNDKIVY
jgi:hypothetical protein